MKLYEFSATLTCAYVVAADNEKAARAVIETFDRAWYECGDFIGVDGVDLVDVRDADPDGLEDLAHEVVERNTKKYIIRIENGGSPWWINGYESGDPGRTVVKANAERFESRAAAGRVLRSAIKANPHRPSLGAATIESAPW